MQHCWYSRPQDRSLRELKQALGRMRAERKGAFVSLGNMMREPEWQDPLHEWPPDVRAAAEPELDWLADQMGDEIVVPRHHLDEDGFEEHAEPAAIQDQLGAVYRSEELRLAGREYELEGPSEPGDAPEQAEPSPAVLPTGDSRNNQEDWNRVLVAEGLGAMPEAALKQPEWRDLPRKRDNMMRLVAEDMGAPAVTLDARTGAPPGRPTRGTRDPKQAARLIQERLGGRPLDELKACLRPGRLTEAQQRDRAALKRVAAELALQKKATREALAQALDINERTVRRWAKAA